jgi:hypothetical protein
MPYPSIESIAKIPVMISVITMMLANCGGSSDASDSLDNAIVTLLSLLAIDVDLVTLINNTVRTTVNTKPIKAIIPWLMMLKAPFLFNRFIVLPPL